MSKFLTAEWKKLILANYLCDPEILKPYVPKGTELDLWNGNCYVSLVGFMFLNTKIKGLPIPFHVNFEEVNLRFYVKQQIGNEIRRGVTFIKEIVPKPMITLVANTVYQEKYQTLPMKHHWNINDNELDIAYQWKLNNEWNKIQVLASNELSSFDNNSEEAFITEHYWGYTPLNNKTGVYEVGHPTWKVYPVKNWDIAIDIEANYGKEFIGTLSQSPISVFLAEGSEIFVNEGQKIKF